MPIWERVSSGLVPRLLACWETYQEHNRHVEQESAGTVEEEGEQANVVNIVHGHPGDLPEEGHHAVDEGAYGGEVVKGDQGVHLELGRAQEALHHGESEGLKGDASDLVDDTDPDELDLAERGDDDTNNNNRDVEEDSEVRLGDTKGPAGEKNRDGRGSLSRRQYAAGHRQGQGLGLTLSIWIKATLR